MRVYAIYRQSQNKLSFNTLIKFTMFYTKEYKN